MRNGSLILLHSTLTLNVNVLHLIVIFSETVYCACSMFTVHFSFSCSLHQSGSSPFVGVWSVKMSQYVIILMAFIIIKIIGAQVILISQFDIFCETKLLLNELHCRHFRWFRLPSIYLEVPHHQPSIIIRKCKPHSKIQPVYLRPFRVLHEV